MKNNSIAYILISPPSHASGVFKKVDGTISALNSLGFYAISKFFNSGIYGSLHFIFFILFCDIKTIIIRFPGVYRTIIFFPFLFLARFSNKNLILDLPTPIIGTIQQMKYSYSNLFTFTIKVFPFFLFYPWVFLPFKRIIQYGVEHPFFLLLVKHKTRLIGNGIDVNAFPLIDHFSDSVIDYPRQINFIAVAQFEKWHGYDRFLLALSNYVNYVDNKYLNVKICLNFVGEGNELFFLKKYVDDNNLSEFVNFYGNLIGKDLDKVFSDSHIAIGSLGAYRVGIYTSSALKLREYAARGIPFIMAENDLDFEENLPFLFKVTNNSSSIVLKDVLSWYSKLVFQKYEFNDIRNYATKKLDYKIKVKKMFL